MKDELKTNFLYFVENVKYTLLNKQFYRSRVIRQQKYRILRTETIPHPTLCVTHIQ
jgi:hypothetical protein